MPLKDKKPERELTDKSLRSEREKTDQEILASKKALETGADRAVHKARESADDVLSTARHKADARTAPGKDVVKTRVVEDTVLEQERDVADENIVHERAQVDHALQRLLPLEREATDRTLLTERARSDAALENRDDLLGVVCHDLRDLLGGIVLNTELLTKEVDSEEEAKRVAVQVSQIQRYAARMSRLIGDLVDVTSIDLGRLSITPRHADTAPLISEVADTFRTIAESKGITLLVDDTLGPATASFDQERILQVLANLLTNSIKFTPQGGTVSVSRKMSGSVVEFMVSDTGVGISPESIGLVFERFWQVGKNDRQGLGLGLHISKCIVESHGGKIWVESTVGEGSRFYFTLPCNVQENS
ncbi:MAG: HAMP domain-containing sensor histidine kinase [Candidatus Paceibacterota bacterium]